jgi:nucleoside-diphosphate-sugar epimerase
VNGGVNRRCYTYIDDAIECSYRIVQNPGGVCDRQIFNIGSPQNEISIRQLAETMRDIYAANFRDKAIPLPEIISVSGEEFYGEGYDDSDRRIPDITKANTLLGWEPRWNIRDTLETTMRYYVSETRKDTAASCNG